MTQMIVTEETRRATTESCRRRPGRLCFRLLGYRTVVSLSSLFPGRTSSGMEGFPPVEVSASKLLGLGDLRINVMVCRRTQTVVIVAEEYCRAVLSLSVDTKLIAACELRRSSTSFFRKFYYCLGSQQLENPRLKTVTHNYFVPSLLRYTSSFSLQSTTINRLQCPAW